MMLRHLHLAVLFALMAFAFAVDLPAGFLHPRQNSPVISGTTDGETTPTTTPAPPTTTTTQAPTTPSPQPPTTTTTQAPPPTTTAAPPPSTTTQAPPPSSTAPGPGPESDSSSDPPSSTTPPPSSITSLPSDTLVAPPSETTITSTNLAPIPEVLTTITFTSDGRLVSSVATGTRTNIPTSTSKPGLASGYGNETNTLSAESKKLIGGIVGGIGGAFLLAGIGFVVYKMWGRKRHTKIAQEEEDYFGGAMSAGSSDSLGKEKKSGWGPSSLTSKFSEPLDRYKSPTQVTSPVAGSWGGRSPNAASNF